MRSRTYRPKCAALGAALLLIGCGGDDPSGPEYGDLVFAPASPVSIGAAREVDLELSNTSNQSLGPINLGAGSTPLSVPREFTCPGLGSGIVITPNQIQSLAGGSSVEVTVTFSFADLTEELCPLATYEVDVNAAIGSTVLGSTQVRLDHTELE